MNYTINLANIKDFPFEKYANDFTFIVNGKRYPTSRFVADIISPIIKNSHYNDESNNEFYITVPNDRPNDYFSDFLRLATYQEINVDPKRLSLYSEYFLQLGNINEFFSIQDALAKPEDANNSIYFIQRFFNNDLVNKFTFIHEINEKHIKNISENFSEIDKKELKNLPIEILEEIINSESLKIKDEDELLDFILELYEEDHESRPLFEYIHFVNVSEEELKKFFNSFDINDLNTPIWHSIFKRLLPSFFSSDMKENLRYSESECVKPFCTFSATGEKFIKQKFYRCLTCNLTDGNNAGICETCAFECHKGHDVRLANYENFESYCDCPKMCNCHCMPETNDLQCTAVITKGKPINQPMYHCQTCNISGESFICQRCAMKFHHGHALKYLGVVESKVCYNNNNI